MATVVTASEIYHRHQPKLSIYERPVGPGEHSQSFSCARNIAGTSGSSINCDRLLSPFSFAGGTAVVGITGVVDAGALPRFSAVRCSAVCNVKTVISSQGTIRIHQGYAPMMDDVVVDHTPRRTPSASKYPASDLTPECPMT